MYLKNSLDEVQYHTHLDVTVDKNLSWHKHIESLPVYKLDGKMLQILYFACVRSKLEYANSGWDNCTNQLSDLLESMHKMRKTRINIINSITPIPGLEHHSSKIRFYQKLLLTGVAWMIQK